MNEIISASSTKSHTWAKVLAVAVLVSLAAASGAWAFLRYSRSPSAKILQSFQNLQKVEAANFEGELTVKGSLVAIPFSFNSDDLPPALTRATLAKPPITVTKRFRVEAVNGVKTQPYAFTLNKKNTIMILDKLAANEPETGVRPKDAAKVKEMLNQIQKLNGTIWLGQKDGLPYKIKIAADVGGQNSSEAMNVSFSLSMRDFNKQINITDPVNRLTLGEAMKKLIGKRFQTGVDAEISTVPVNLPSSVPVDQDADQDGLSDILEDFYGTSKTSRDTDEDGYDDKTEVDGGYDPLTSATS